MSKAGRYRIWQFVQDREADKNQPSRKLSPDDIIREVDQALVALDDALAYIRLLAKATEIPVVKDIAALAHDSGLPRRVSTALDLSRRAQHEHLDRLAEIRV